MAKTNKWLDSTVRAYIGNFGYTMRPCVWDVGSRDGKDGVELAKRIYDESGGKFWRSTRVVCLEPNPEQVKIIKDSYPKAEVMQLAVTDTVGVAPFKVYHGDEGTVGSSSLKLDWKDGIDGHTINVKTERLENLVDDEQIDIMKIDVEGFSLLALQGLGDKISRVKVFHIETETWTHSNDIIKIFMVDRGFALADEWQQYGGMPDQVWVNINLANERIREYEPEEHQS